MIRCARHRRSVQREEQAHMAAMQAIFVLFEVQDGHVHLHIRQMPDVSREGTAVLPSSAAVEDILTSSA